VRDLFDITFFDMMSCVVSLNPRGLCYVTHFGLSLLHFVMSEEAARDFDDKQFKLV